VDDALLVSQAKWGDREAFDGRGRLHTAKQALREALRALGPEEGC